MTVDEAGKNCTLLQVVHLEPRQVCWLYFISSSNSCNLPVHYQETVDEGCFGVESSPSVDEDSAIVKERSCKHYIYTTTYNLK